MERFYENQQYIQSVLHYWFVQYGTPDQVQKKLWMIPDDNTTTSTTNTTSSLSSYRDEIDYDITKKFLPLLIELSEWYTTTFDHDNKKTNTSSSSLRQQQRWHEWCNVVDIDNNVGITTNTSTNKNTDDTTIESLKSESSESSSLFSLYGYQGKVAAILVLDQFSRHIHRYKKKFLQQQQQEEEERQCVVKTNPTTNHNPNGLDPSLSLLSLLLQRLPEQCILDEIAFRTTYLFHTQHTKEIHSGMMIPIPHYIFALMPYRHYYNHNHHQNENENNMNHAPTTTTSTTSTSTTTKLENLQYVQKQIESIMVPIHNEIDHMIKRFRKATNRRVAIEQDKNRNNNTIIPNQNTITTTTHNNKLKQQQQQQEEQDQSVVLSLNVPRTTTTTTSTNMESQQQTLEPNVEISSSSLLLSVPIMKQVEPDQQQQQPNEPPEQQSESNNAKNGFVYTEDDILECYPFQTDMVPSIDHPVHQTIYQFLIHHGRIPLPLPPPLPQEESTSTTSTTTNHKNHHQPTNKNKNKNNNASSSQQQQSENYKEGPKQQEQEQEQSSSYSSGTVDTNDVTTGGTTTTTTPGPRRRRIYPVIVSLSGGVDSMVILRVLTLIRDHCCIRSTIIQLYIIAIHIDYGNRNESNSEAQYVEQYCKNILQIDEYHCRYIHEVTRGMTARDQYEKIAREIRYQCYRDIIQSITNKISSNTNTNTIESTTIETTTATTPTSMNESSPPIGVMLGHHRGDVRENVLSNVHKGCGPLELSGMTIISKNDGVWLYRPLLTLEKHDIYSYAHTYGVPYFKDTTPKWSTRGKIRNTLLPLLEEIYGEGYDHHLNQLAYESDECKHLFFHGFVQPFQQTIIYEPMGISFLTTISPTVSSVSSSNTKNSHLYYWKFVLRPTLHSVKLGMFSDKSVETFVQRITGQNATQEKNQHNNNDQKQQQQQQQQSSILREGWLQCRKDYGVYLRADGRVYILYPKSFPWQKKDYYNNNNNNNNNKVTTTTNFYGIEHPIQVGPWNISAEVIMNGITHDTTITCTDSDSSNHIERNVNELLTKKAFTSMDEFMKGSMEYYLKVPTTLDNKTMTYHPHPLVLTKFTKATRPSAWKNIDTKIQETLPLLGFCSQSSSSCSDNKNHHDDIEKEVQKEDKVSEIVGLNTTTNTSSSLSSSLPSGNSTSAWKEYNDIDEDGLATQPDKNLFCLVKVTLQLQKINP